MQKPNRILLYFLLIVLSVFFIIVFAVSNNEKNNQNGSLGTGVAPVTTNNQPPIVNTPQEPVTCVSFEYSDWSSCSENGEQYRTISNMLPAGCSGGNPVQSQKCEYKPKDVGTAPEMLARMVDQIRNAHDQTIESSYVTGQNGELLQKLSYQILDNALVIKSTLIHRDTNVSEPTVDFIDTNLDGFVDRWAGEDRNVHAFTKEEYQQAQTAFGFYLVNFVNTILTK